MYEHLNKFSNLTEILPTPVGALSRKGTKYLRHAMKYSTKWHNSYPQNPKNWLYMCKNKLFKIFDEVDKVIQIFVSHSINNYFGCAVMFFMKT